MRPPAPQKVDNRKIPVLLGPKAENHEIPVFYLKVQKYCDFPLFGVRGPSKTINKPLVLMVLGAMGAKGPPFR